MHLLQRKNKYFLVQTGGKNSLTMQSSFLATKVRNMVKSIICLCPHKLHGKRDIILIANDWWIVDCGFILFCDEVEITVLYDLS